VITAMLAPTANFYAEIAGWQGTPSPASWWDTPSTGTMLEADILVEQDNIKGYYYYAVQGSFVDGTAFYGGVQINGNNGNGSVLPRMAIFSVWDTYSGTPAAGGWGVVFGGEGTGYSVRISYPWIAGIRYTMRFALQSDNGTTRVWRGEIVNNSNGVTTLIGTINTRSSVSNISRSIATFHERFWGPIDSCSSLEPSRVVFSSVRLDWQVASLASSNLGTAGLCPGSGSSSTAFSTQSWFNSPPPPPVYQPTPATPIAYNPPVNPPVTTSPPTAPQTPVRIEPPATQPIAATIVPTAAPSIEQSPTLQPTPQYMQPDVPSNDSPDGTKTNAAVDNGRRKGTASTYVTLVMVLILLLAAPAMGVAVHKHKHSPARGSN
jgi:hypothetical protein